MHPPVASLFLDLGSSLTKGFFAYGTEPASVLTMSSDVSMPLLPAQLDFYRQRHRDMRRRPENGAWITRSDKTRVDETRAVGLLAQNFSLDTGLAERKERRAVDKILAAIGVMHACQDVPRPKGFQATPLPLRLGVVLPFDEFASHAAILTELAAHTRFEFCDMPRRFELVTAVRFAPEGYCLSRQRMLELVQQDIKPASRDLVVLMLGHRNASCLVLEQNEFQRGKSTSQGPGFMEAVKYAFQAGAFQATDTPKLLEALIRSQTKVVLTGDDYPTDISHAIQIGISAYWSALEKFLKWHLSPHLSAKTEIVISGGASTLVAKQLGAFFKQLEIERKRLTFYKSPELAQLLTANGYDVQDNPAWVSRMGDAYVGFQGLVRSPQQHAA